MKLYDDKWLVLSIALALFTACWGSYAVGRIDQSNWDAKGCWCPMTCDPAVVP